MPCSHTFCPQTSLFHQPFFDQAARFRWEEIMQCCQQMLGGSNRWIWRKLNTWSIRRCWYMFEIAKPSQLHNHKAFGLNLGWLG